MLVNTYGILGVWVGMELIAMLAGHSQLVQQSWGRTILRCGKLVQLCFQPQHTGRSRWRPRSFYLWWLMESRKPVQCRAMCWRAVTQIWCMALSCLFWRAITETIRRKSLLKSLGAHVKEHYPNASYGVYPIEDDSKLAILVAANKYSPNNFW